MNFDFDDFQIELTSAQLYVCAVLVAAGLIGFGMVLGHWLL